VRDGPAFSCDPSLYAGGGLYEADAFERPASQDALASRVAPLYGAYAYERPIHPERLVGSPDFVARLIAHDAWINGMYPRGAASALVRLGRSRLRDRRVHVADGDRWRPLYEAERFVDRPYLDASHPAGEVERLPKGPTYLHLGSAGSFNYGHFLGRRPRALPGPRSRGRRAALRPHDLARCAIDAVREAALRTVAGDRAFDLRFLQAAVTYEVDRLLYPSPVTLHPALKSPEALEDLAATATASCRNTPTYARSRGRRWRRIHVARRVERGRALANAEEVARVLAARRFVVVDPEALSFAEQVAVFSDADVVVGAMGAAMTNTLFCRPGARVLYLAPEGWLEPFYWDLAAVRGHAYGACYGQAGEGEPHLAPFAVAARDLERALEVLL
jgi:hypothetical protein